VAERPDPPSVPPTTQVYTGRIGRRTGIGAHTLGFECVICNPKLYLGAVDQ